MKGFHVEWNHRNVNTHQALTFTDQQQQVIEPTDQKVKQDYTSALNPTSEKLEVSISNPPPADKRWKMSIKGVVKSAKPKSFAELKASHFKIIEREPTVPNANAKKSQTFGIFTWLLFAVSIGLQASGMIIPIVGLILPIIQLVFAILAISYGNLAKREIYQNPDKYSNKGAAILGKTLGIVYLILLLITLLFIIFLILLLASL